MKTQVLVSYAVTSDFGVKGTVLFIYLITALFSTASIIWLLVDSKIGYIIYGMLMIILMLFVLKTDILIEHKRINKKNSEVINEKK